MMHVENISAHELSDEHWAAWVDIQESNRSLDSPYFRPEFTEAAAHVRDNVEVAVLLDDNRPVGFLPYERSGRLAKPVGGILSDFQGLIARSDFDVAPEALLRHCRLAVWDFDHLLAWQKPFHRYHRLSDVSPFIDVDRGFFEYEAQLRERGSRTIQTVGRKARKLRREIGPLRFVSQTDEPSVFDTLIKWKIAQYQKSGAPNIFAVGWTLDLLKLVLNRRRESFSAVMSALYAGDRLAAVHLGIRSRGVLHWWFPAYNPHFSQYSPGLILLVELANAAPAWGIRRIDLGKGRERYKTSLMTGGTPLAEGSVTCGLTAGVLRQSWWTAQRWVRRSPLRGPTQRLVRNARLLLAHAP